MAVIRMIQMVPPSSTQLLVALVPMPLAPNSRNTYWLATWARLAMTSTSATTMAQPPNQPVFGPNAPVAHVNVVPHSGTALFSSLYPIDASTIRTNASTATACAWSAPGAWTYHGVAAMLERGASDVVAITVVEIRPRAPDFRPLSSCCSVGCLSSSAVAMAHLSWQRPGRDRPGHAGGGE